MTTEQKITAIAAYENANLVAHDLVGRISELLLDLPAPDDDNSIHWGHVGDLSEINNRLAGVVEFLSSKK